MRHALAASLCLLTACVTPQPPPLAPLVVHPLATQTVGTDGSLRDGEWKGNKRVRIFVEPGAHALKPAGQGVTVSYRRPGGFPDQAAAELVPGSTTEFSFDIPTSEDLELCEAILYRWEVLYDHAGTGTNGVYLGAERFVMPTKETRNGTLFQALCAEPGD